MNIRDVKTNMERKRGRKLGWGLNNIGVIAAPLCEVKGRKKQSKSVLSLVMFFVS